MTEILRQAARLIGFKNKQYEALTEINAAGMKLRIWSACKSLEAAKTFDHPTLQEKMRKVAASIPADQWTQTLMALPNVACVAIVNSEGNGVSAYPDWG